MHVYDFDGTIYRGDSTVDFLLYVMKKQPFALRFVPRQAMGFLLYGLKRIDKTQLKEAFFCFLSGIDSEAMVEDFWNHKQDGIEKWYLAQQQEDDAVISASPEFLLKPICERLGIRHLIASEVDPKSGRFLSKNCKGQEKVNRWKQQWPEAKIDSFYSDSRSDLPMAQLASKAFLVKNGERSPWYTETV